MRIAFKTQCPYKIKDKIQFDTGNNVKVMEITDIITKHSLKTGKAIFILELDGWYKLDTNLYDVKIQ